MGTITKRKIASFPPNSYFQNKFSCIIQNCTTAHVSNFLLSKVHSLRWVLFPWPRIKNDHDTHPHLPKKWEDSFLERLTTESELGWLHWGCSASVRQTNVTSMPRALVPTHRKEIDERESPVPGDDSSCLVSSGGSLRAPLAHLCQREVKGDKWGPLWEIRYLLKWGPRGTAT